MYLGHILGQTEPSQIVEAEEHILRGISMLAELQLKPQYARGYFYLGSLYGQAGQQEKALENLKKAETMFQEMDMDYWLGETRKILAGF